MSNQNRNDALLHGVTLAMILDFLVDEYGFEELGEMIRINCFKSNPTKSSSLKFLRKTEWARLQVQGLYVRTMLEKRNNPDGKDTRLEIE
ncbi:MAG: VF530 family protein [Candidatus Gracilibacteria bacterium]|nr:VF530 family protein [Candidatus Gracilibacteria bacterium]